MPSSRRVGPIAAISSSSLECQKTNPSLSSIDLRMKKIGFLSFGHWTPSPASQTRSASDSLLQSIELAVAAEELGADGAYFRVHHFAPQLGSPFPLLAAIGARTRRIEIRTAVIDMRYEKPYLALHKTVHPIAYCHAPAPSYPAVPGHGEHDLSRTPDGEDPAV